MNKILNYDSPIVTIFGGSGFLGRYIVRRMVKRGWRVRVAVREPNEAIFLKTYGEVGQIEIFNCSIFNQASVLSSITGSTAVINCVAGLLNESVQRRFISHYVEGPELIAKLSTKLKVQKLIHISSIGASLSSNSIYAKSKAKGEGKVLENFPNATILRPSLVFGDEDSFFNRYAAMATYSLFIPVIGQSTMFQPVYVDDVAQAIERALTQKDIKGIFELGGPDILTHRELIEKMLLVIRRKRIIVSISFPLASLMAIMFNTLKMISGGLFNPPFSLDNVKQLSSNNTVDHEAKSLSDLGIKSQNIDNIIPSYLYCFRPHGQYNETTQTAKKFE